MHKSNVAGTGIQGETFDVRYKEAKRWVSEHNDLEAALACLATMRPATKSELWQWTDLAGALLNRQCRYSECHRVWTSYDTLCPGDPSVAQFIEVLEKRIAATA